MSNQSTTPDPRLPTCCGSLSEALPPELFKALSDPNRVRLLSELAARGGAVSVSEAAACCPVDLSVVSRHLALLKSAGVLEATKKGREVYYRARCAELAGLLRNLAGLLENCCPPGGAPAGPTTPVKKTATKKAARKKK